MMEKELVDYINAQRAEAEEFSKQPGCWMGSMVEPSDLEYWSQRAPCGTLKGFQRIELEEDAYYSIADAYSKSYARSFDFASMTDAELDEVIKDACDSMEREEEELKQRELQENITRNKMCKDFGVSRETLDRWLEEAEAA
jgi:pyridoxine/pyridoxamine 5'-phosphate oxidase